MRKFTTTIITLLTLLTLSVNSVAAETGYVSCNLLNVRVSPSTSSDIVTQLEKNTSFEIIYTDNGWYNIRMQSGKTGFVAAQYVTKNSTAVSSNASDVAKRIASDAYNYIGCRYSYGSSGPSAFDCSGFTSYLYKRQGYSLPRTSNSQGSYGTHVEKQNLTAGDLVFFSNRSDRKINHVGVYVGNNNFIHASTSVRGVVIDNLGSDYYKRNYVTARRIL
ncbi:MAG: C40 family peptidase [Clostridia bacterium]|nr:C40 family peptidase [Clostridia bacterium]